MAQDESKEHSAKSPRHVRVADRRVRNLIAPPPFATRDGRIDFDRRSHIDRRSSWLKSFFIEQADGQQD